MFSYLTDADHSPARIIYVIFTISVCKFKPAQNHRPASSD